MKQEASSGSEESDDAAEEGGADGVDGEDEGDLVERSALVHTAEEGGEVHKVVVKRERSLPLEYLSQPLLSSSSSSPIPPAQLPKGGKAFEEREFSSGLLLLPPRAVKQRELTNTVESFIVFSAARESLQVTIGSEVFRLSKGDPFMVPCGNVYSLENLSSVKDIKVYFHLIKGAEQLQQQTHSSSSTGRGRATAAGSLSHGNGKDEKDEASDEEEALK